MKQKIFAAAAIFAAFTVNTMPTFAQNDDTWWENMNNNKYDAQKADRDLKYEKEQKNLEAFMKAEEKVMCIQAPSDGALTIGYDREIYRTKSGTKNLPKLNGVKIGGTIRGRFNKAPFLGIEFPIALRYGYSNDTKRSGCKYFKTHEFGYQFGLLLTTGYKFTKDFNIAIAIGPKLDFLFLDVQNQKTNDGVEYHNEFVWGDAWAKYNGEKQIFDKSEQTKFFKLPLSMGITFRYKKVGLSFYYDRCLTNTIKNHPNYSTFYRDHMTLSLNIYDI